MKIYQASVYHTVKAEDLSLNQRITKSNRLYPYILESFFYFDTTVYNNIISDKREVKVFMDSGAFSAFTRDVIIDIKRYARFLKNYTDVYDVASNLDIVGYDKGKENYANLKILENLAGPGLVNPVHHVRDNDDWLKRYVDEGYNYIFIGGMVPESVPVLREWLDHIWFKYLTNDDGSPKVKVHGFGLTTEELMFRYPWYSVDSTAWLLAAGFGEVFLTVKGLYDLPNRIKINFSEVSKKSYQLESSNFWCMEKKQQENIREQLSEIDKQKTWLIDKRLVEDFKAEIGVELSITPEALAKSYGMRRVVNMDYYLRLEPFCTKKFVQMQETLF